MAINVGKNFDESKLSQPNIVRLPPLEIRGELPDHAEEGQQNSAAQRNEAAHVTKKALRVTRAVEKRSGNGNILKRQLNIFTRNNINPADAEVFVGCSLANTGDVEGFTGVVKELQEVAGLTGKNIDGLLGPQTIRALYGLYVKNPNHTFFQSSAQHEGFYERIAALQKMYDGLTGRKFKKSLADDAKV